MRPGSQQPDHRCPYCGQMMSIALLVEKLINNSIVAERTVEDIKFLMKAKVDAPDKEIYNALGFLARRKRIRRLGYGRYAKCETPKER